MPEMDQGRVIRFRRSQAVRLPKSVAFPDDVEKVDVIVVGNARLLTPVGEAWSTWFDGEGVSEDFMLDRGQPSDQQRRARLTKPD